MKKLLICILLFTSITCLSQKKYKTVKRTLSISHKEVYSFEKKTKQKDGFYYILNVNTRDTLVYGTYTNDAQTGVWKYYRKDATPYFEFDFDNELLCRFDRNESEDSTYIKKGNEFILDKVDNPQLYKGFENEALMELATSIKLPLHVVKSGQSGRCLYSIIIDKKGELASIEVEKSLNEEFDKLVIKSLENLKYKWIAATKNGVPVESKTLLLVKISKDTVSNHKLEDKPYLWQMMLSYYSEVKVTRTPI